MALQIETADEELRAGLLAVIDALYKSPSQFDTDNAPGWIYFRNNNQPIEHVGNSFRGTKEVLN